MRLLLLGVGGGGKRGIRIKPYPYYGGISKGIVWYISLLKGDSGYSKGIVWYSTGVKGYGGFTKGSLSA